MIVLKLTNVGLIFENSRCCLTICNGSAIYSNYLVLARDQIVIVILGDAWVNLVIHHNLHATSQRSFTSSEQFLLLASFGLFPPVCTLIPIPLLQVLLLTCLIYILVVVITLGHLLVFFWDTGNT